MRIMKTMICCGKKLIDNAKNKITSGIVVHCTNDSRKP